jgi:uncharacterized protein
MPNSAAKPAPPTPEPAPAEATPPRARPNALLDDEALVASRRLLSRLVPQSEAAKEGTLEALLMDLLRPMLAERLNDHLPQVVNRVVAQELARLAAPADVEPETKASPRPA